ncbi:cystathionine beta-lyase [Bacillus sp. FJAT-27225]|uniref:MalY/PatB family protein n=1 Tax=Bacillus sp. FJAT-27225 TaxID=1743144 RepID=UPI00080C2951|nr:MalY/PatB family protein [Bacillus sp. FJAT-27225]OCA87583.1 cystathionine beta-lyase [Bacillus sp. FJAT-27225]
MNFDEKIDRLRTASVKWEMTKEIYGTADVLPMWVADMDFHPPQQVLDAIKARVDHGVFGYTFVPPVVYRAISSWVEQRHSWQILPSWILFSPGVVPSISIAIQSFSQPGDRILVQPPVYTPFFDMAELNGRIVERSPLVLKDGRYEIDFDSFEASLKKGCKLFLLCNPHNPGGRVWTKDELLRMSELCIQYDCLILSDEIHSDIVFSGHRHIPIASLGDEIAEKTITCIAPSKTFNLAGLQTSAVIISNESLKETFQANQKRQGFFTLNAIGIAAMEAAYAHGSDWLERLITYLDENVTAAREFIARELPDVKLVEPDASYLLWLDCRQLGLTDDELMKRLVEVGKVGLEPGPKYGTGGEGFLRMNIGCPRDVLIDGLQRIKKALG